MQTCFDITFQRVISMFYWRQALLISLIFCIGLFVVFSVAENTTAAIQVAGTLTLLSLIGFGIAKLSLTEHNLMTNYSKSRTSFIRRIYIAYLIDTGVNTVPLLIKETGMPRRTVQDAITALSDIGIVCAFSGAPKNGNYQIHDWGPINDCWIRHSLQHINDVLHYT